MISFFRSKYFLKVREIYFASGSLSSVQKRDIDMYVQSSVPISSRSIEFSTLLIDLAADQSRLEAALSKKNRYEIHRAIKNDSLECFVDFSPNSRNTSKFIRFYNEFASFKDLAPGNVNKLNVLREFGSLIIAEVVNFESKETYAMHCYISDGNRARLYYSATLPRESTRNKSIDYQILGRANKLLHWKTMLCMKAHGIRFYDLGGISGSSEMKGIDDFKRQFGGVEVIEYNDIVSISITARLALFLKSFIKR